MITEKEAREKAELDFSYFEDILKRSNIDYSKKLDEKINKSYPYSLTMQESVDFLLEEKWGSRIGTFAPSDHLLAYKNKMYELSKKTAEEVVSKGNNTELAHYVSKKIVGIAEGFLHGPLPEYQHIRAA